MASTFTTWYLPTIPLGLWYFSDFWPFWLRPFRTEENTWWRICLTCPNCLWPTTSTHIYQCSTSLLYLFFYQWVHTIILSDLAFHSFALCLQCSLGYCLFNIAGEHIAQPLKNFKMTLPKEWGMPLGWSLTFIPILIILAGLLFHVIWKSRGIPFKMVRLKMTCRAYHFMKKLP